MNNNNNLCQCQSFALFYKHLSEPNYSVAGVKQNHIFSETRKRYFKRIKRKMRYLRYLRDIQWASYNVFEQPNMITVTATIGAPRFLSQTG